MMLIILYIYIYIIPRSYRHFFITRKTWLRCVNDTANLSIDPTVLFSGITEYDFFRAFQTILDNVVPHELDIQMDYSRFMNNNGQQSRDTNTF